LFAATQFQQREGRSPLSHGLGQPGAVGRAPRAGSSRGAAVCGARIHSRLAEDAAHSYHVSLQVGEEARRVARRLITLCRSDSSGRHWSASGGAGEFGGRSFGTNASGVSAGCRAFLVLSSDDTAVRAFERQVAGRSRAARCTSRVNWTRSRETAGRRSSRARRERPRSAGCVHESRFLRSRRPGSGSRASAWSPPLGRLSGPPCRRRQRLSPESQANPVVASSWRSRRGHAGRFVAATAGSTSERAVGRRSPSSSNCVRQPRPKVCFASGDDPIKATGFRDRPGPAGRHSEAGRGGVPRAPWQAAPRRRSGQPPRLGREHGRAPPRPGLRRFPGSSDCPTIAPRQGEHPRFRAHSDRRSLCFSRSPENPRMPARL
jgi:hypothetical protein